MTEDSKWMNDPGVLFMNDVKAWFGRKEGCKRDPETGLLITYFCPTGHETTGFGHKLTAKELAENCIYIDEFNPDPDAADRIVKVDVRYREGMNDYQANRILSRDLQSALEGTYVLFCRAGGGKKEEEFTGNRVRLWAIAAMMFQMGVAGITDPVDGFPGMCRAIDARDWPEAAKEALDSKWAREDSPARAIETAYMIEHNAPPPDELKYWPSLA